jgi:putative ABC transport system permease protein
MIKNYWKISLRYMNRHKTYSFINIAGLSIGLAVSMLIGLWIYDEWSYNRAFDNYHRIALVIRQMNYNSQRINLPGSPYAMRDELLSKYPEDFSSVVMSTAPGYHLMGYGDEHYLRQGRYMDPEGAELFSLHMLSGTRAGLSQPSGVLLSRSMAAAIFGNADPMGKTIRLDGVSEAKVTGTYEDFPYNSYLKNTVFIASMRLYLMANPGEAGVVSGAANPWLYHDALDAFVKLSEHADIRRVSAKLRDLRRQKMSAEDYKNLQMIDYLHPMSRWRLYSDFENATGYAVREKIEYVRLLGFIGVLVLLLACINFVNLSTARSEKRAREVGVRKTIGSLRAQLVGQFLFESLLSVAMAFFLSVIWVSLAIPEFNAVVSEQISIPWASPGFWVVCLGCILVTGLVAGLYPAFYLSGFQPVQVLKGTFRAGPWARVPRKVLVVFQFTVSIGLIICTMVIYRQIKYAARRDIGYERGGLVMITMTPDIRKNFTIISDELKRSGAVTEVAASQNTTVDYNIDDNRISWEGMDRNKNVDWAVSKVTLDYGRTIGWQVIDGRDFSRDFPTDSMGLVLNEAAVRQIGWKDPIGRIIQFRGRPFHVIGVIRNIIFESPYLLASSPSLFHLADGDELVTTIRLNPRLGATQALDAVRPVFEKYNPAYPFDYRFVDQEYAKKFGEEDQIGKLSGFFTALAILISCLGLFGLVSFMAEQRRKEIGIRKVLGASEFSVWRLLSKEFLGLVVLSMLFAAPAAWYYMHGWLQQYEYRYSISWLIFAMAGGGALVVALLTVGYQAVKAARANPVESLRSE